MTEKYLPKKEFIEMLKKLGVPEEELENEWNKLSLAFGQALLTHIFSTLSEKELNNLEPIMKDKEALGAKINEIISGLKEQTRLDYILASQKAAFEIYAHAGGVQNE